MSAASSGTNGIEQTEPAPLMLGRVRSLESSVLYLQQQHAETLRGLHEEIRNLQKRNSGTKLLFKIVVVLFLYLHR